MAKAGEAAEDSAVMSESEAQTEPKYVSDQLLVRFREGTSEQRITQINQTLNVQVLRTMRDGHLQQILIPKGESLEHMKEAYLFFPEVEAVNFNFTIHPLEKIHERP